MKKKSTKIIACLLAFALMLPLVAFSEYYDDNNDYDDEWHFEVEVVPLRQTAYDHGATVLWDDETRTIHIILANGFPILLPLDSIRDFGGFVLDGVTWLPAVILEYWFAIGAGMRFIVLTEEAREYVLEDFDYLMQQILENSPWASVIERRADFTLEELIEVNRYFIYDMYMLQVMADLPDGIDWTRSHDNPRDLAADYLFALLTFEFSNPIAGIGHMSPLLPLFHRDMLVRNMRSYIEYGGEMTWESDFGGSLILQAFTHPQALWFYGTDDIDFDVEGHGMYDPYNVHAEILVPGEIAYIAIESFLNNRELDDAIIYPFLNEIRDFDHLIIDIRGNGGGYVVNFYDITLRRIITEPLIVRGFEFFSSGELAREWADFFIGADGAVVGGDALSIEGIHRATDFIEEHGMTHFNQDDLEMLHYVVFWYTEILPVDEPIGFDGKIWLLVDAYSASASAMITLTALDTGFATVVGENTSGVMGSMTSFVVLPNTGIIFRIDIGYQTDDDGRSFEEYGIAPNVRNHDGLDALETVLELINTVSNSEH